MTGLKACGGGGVLASCALGSATDLVTESQETCGNNSSGGEERRPSVDLSALERKAVRGGITRFHCRYFLRQRQSDLKKQQMQLQHQNEDDEQADEQSAKQPEGQQQQQQPEDQAASEQPEQQSNRFGSKRSHKK